MNAEDEKALLELQDRMLNSSQTLYKLNAQERTKQQMQHRTNLMVSELKALPDSVPTYKAVGKAYFLAAKGEVIAEAEAEVASITTELQNIKNQKGIVQSKAKETENELLELVKGSPQLRQQLAA